MVKPSIASAASATFFSFSLPIFDDSTLGFFAIPLEEARGPAIGFLAGAVFFLAGGAGAGDSESLWLPLLEATSCSRESVVPGLADLDLRENMLGGCVRCQIP